MRTAQTIGTSIMQHYWHTGHYQGEYAWQLCVMKIT